jgi:hypothetical protein
VGVAGIGEGEGKNADMLTGPEELVEVVTCRVYAPVERREKRRREKGGETSWGCPGCPAACVKENCGW